MNIQLNDQVRVTAVTRDGRIIKEDSGMGSVVSIRRKYFFVILRKSGKAIKFDMEGNGVNCMYKTTIENLTHHD